MTQSKSNIILTGMPGSGKSNVAVILSKLTERDFIDTDILIRAAGVSVQDIVDTDGHRHCAELTHE